MWLFTYAPQLVLHFLGDYGRKLSVFFVFFFRFAAEIFHDLHEDIMTIVSRSQNLKTRVTQLEANLPAIEKALLAEASQSRFAYTERKLPGSDPLFPSLNFVGRKFVSVYLHIM